MTTTRRLPLPTRRMAELLHSLLRDGVVPPKPVRRLRTEPGTEHGTIVACRKRGWIEHKRGRWRITDAGVEALQRLMLFQMDVEAGLPTSRRSTSDA